MLVTYLFPALPGYIYSRVDIYLTNVPYNPLMKSVPAAPHTQTPPALAIPVSNCLYT
jgi:hypothetical protein